MRFPIYHLFEAMAPFAGGQVMPVTISDPLTVAALSLVLGDQQCTIIGNLRDTPQRVGLQGVQGQLSLQTLGDRAGSIEFDQAQATVWLDLAPYTLVKLLCQKSQQS